MNITILGAGLVGSAIARDLAADGGFAVTASDSSDTTLARLAGDERIRRVRCDASDPAALRDLLAPADLVIGAVPGYLGFQVLKSVIELRKNVVDISFFPEDPFALDELAKRHGVTAIMDCGLAPGLGNVLLGRMTRELDPPTRFLCYVGGLPAVRRKPYEYAVVFSPVDVIEEYTRPARYIENGAAVTMPALTGIEHLDFAEVGTLEAFNTDGLRTLAVTIPLPDMKEMTMRYPGHADLMRVFRDTGFFRKDTVDVNGVPVRPLDLTARLLFPAWSLPEGEEDLSVMRVLIDGLRDGRPVRRRFDLLDRFDRATNTTSMARTTGYTCSVAARLVAGGVFTRKGLCPPEYLGMEKASSEALFSGLRERGIVFSETEEAL
jgi:lysine 6-dehydrogenase